MVDGFITIEMRMNNILDKYIEMGQSECGTVLQAMRKM